MSDERNGSPKPANNAGNWLGLDLRRDRGLPSRTGRRYLDASKAGKFEIDDAMEVFRHIAYSTANLTTPDQETTFTGEAYRSSHLIQVP